MDNFLPRGPFVTSYRGHPQFLHTRSQSVPGHFVSIRILMGGVSLLNRFRSTSYVRLRNFLIVSVCPRGSMYEVSVARIRSIPIALVSWPDEGG